MAAALFVPAGMLWSGGSLAGTAGSAPPEAAFGGALFIENAGQWPDAARFQVWGSGQTLWLAEDAIWITMIGTGEASPEDLAADQMPRMDEPSVLPRESHGMPRPYTTGVNLRLSFPGANPHPRLEPFDRLETHVSYFIGADPAKWRADVPVWGGVRYRDLYPGVDLEITGENGQWQWRLIENTLSPLVSLKDEGARRYACGSKARMVWRRRAVGCASPRPSASSPCPCCRRRKGRLKPLASRRGQTGPSPLM